MAGGIAANAAVGETEYPKDAEFTRTLALSSLNDYAIEDGLYAFADGEYVKVYNGGNYDEYEIGTTVADVEIKGGVVYYGSGGRAYSLPDRAECEFSFTAKPSEITSDGFYYYYSGENLKIYDRVNETTATYAGYSLLNTYGGKVYAASGNKLYTFAGSDNSEVVLEYAVKPKDVKITIGQASSDLKKYSGTKFVNIAEGSYMTEVDLEKLDGEYFVPLNIVRTEEKTTALLLCYSGKNVAIVSIKDRAYAVMKDKVDDDTKINYLTENPYTTAQMIGMNIYASPFVVSGTVANSDALGITVKVLNRIENEVLESVFYEVEYGEENTKGYVAEGFLTGEIRGDNKTPNVEPDPAFSENSDTKTILIILAVIILVLAALAYILYVSGKGRKKEKKQKADSNEEKQN